jgi:hypothetical protein
MRIQGVTGDLPAVAHLGAGAAPVEQPAAVASPPAVAAAAATTEADGDHTSSDRRRPPPQLPVFDPPLIAQRAALGLPVGAMVAEHARSAEISYNAAWAAVDQAMPAVKLETSGARPAP